MYVAFMVEEFYRNEPTDNHNPIVDDFDSWDEIAEYYGDLDLDFPDSEPDWDLNGGIFVYNDGEMDLTITMIEVDPNEVDPCDDSDDDLEGFDQENEEVPEWATDPSLVWN